MTMNVIILAFKWSKDEDDEEDEDEKNKKRKTTLDVIEFFAMLMNYR